METAHSPTPESGRRLPALDGVRGIAILLVMFHHYAQIVFTPTLLDRALVRFFGFGWVGVDLFFVLSGFLITSLLLEAKGSPTYFRSFYARRTLRIFPLYYACLVVAVVLIPLWTRSTNASLSPEYQNLVAHQAWYWSYLQNFLLSFRIDWRSVPAFAIPPWSLAIEEQFYLVWPLVVLYTSPRQLGRICWGALILSVVLRFAWWTAAPNPIGVYKFTLTHLDPLVLGASVALVARREGALQRVARWLFPAAVVSLAIIVVLSLRLQPIFEFARPMQLYGFTPLAIIATSLVVTALIAPGGSPIRRVLESRPLLIMGKYSYALYLFHVPILIALIEHGWTPGVLPRVGGSTMPGFFVFAAGCALTALLAAALSWHLFESRVLALKRFFPYRAVPRRGSRATVQQTDALAESRGPA